MFPEGLMHPALRYVLNLYCGKIEHLINKKKMMVEPTAFTRFIISIEWLSKPKK
ncbi:hypothetical protein P278_30390 [Zhouia amylolytica AD3]|uniref:Uncharacterized protein n=1 Tax=Zhouia amylolytica AD3 TaxID=1286632 RepID=W2UJB3_9FLAO|nr:hypothetical protein P278_30390 [Zhouia amylolytica AD3]